MFTSAFFTKLAALSRAFLPLFFKRDWTFTKFVILALFLSVFYLENSCYFCDFCEICRLLEGLLLDSLYRFKFELRLNLLFLRYLIACLSSCNVKYWLLFRFLPNLRLSRGSSLPSFLMIRILSFSFPELYIHTYIHIRYLNTIWFKAQSLWGREKIITKLMNKAILKIRITRGSWNNITYKIKLQ